MPGAVARLSRRRLGEGGHLRATRYGAQGSPGYTGYHIALSPIDVSSVQRTALCLAGIFLLIYVPDIGHGLVRDDFGWIRHSRLGDGRSVADLLQANVGFYRPLVMVSFAIDYAIWGVRPVGYALTNLVLAVGNAALIFVLARRLTLPPAAALVSAAVWLLNFHGINVSLLWLSGRTALMVTLCALLAAIQFASRRRAAATVCALMAMLCKEEAVVLPALFTAVAFFEEGGARQPVASLGKAVRRAWPVWLALAIYFPMRFNSGAFGAGECSGVLHVLVVPRSRPEESRGVCRPRRNGGVARLDPDGDGRGSARASG